MLTFYEVLNRPYEVAHRPFTVTAADGVRIAGVHLDRRDTDLLIIYAHGFLSNKNHRAVPRFVELLGERFDVMAFDFRGHGKSEGVSSFCDGEILDLDAVVSHARTEGYRTIVTVGSSMGGATAILHAALSGGVDGVATIGAFADARDLRRPMASVGLNLAFNTGLGGSFAALARGTRLGDLVLGEQPVNVVDRIAPTPLLLIHGEWDPLIHPEDAALLYAKAGEPKDLFVIPRGGHDIPLLNRDTVDLIHEWITRRVLPPEG